jgi:hypothetical protein
MDSAISTRFPPLPGETLRAKAAHLTVGACFVLGAVVFMWSAWDELTCVAGEITSNGPCGIGVGAAGFIFPAGVCLAVVGVIVLVRAMRRPIDADASDAWRTGQALVVIASGIAIGLMIPRYACPAGTHLSPVFRFCTSAERAFPAPSPGLPWKFAAAGIGFLIGILMIRWRSMPWWLASTLVVAAFLGAILLTASRTTGLPWVAYRSFTVGDAEAALASSQTGDQVTMSSTRRISPNDSAKWVGARIVPG